MPLTDARIRSLKPKAEPFRVSDFGGLYITVTPAVSRLWHLEYRVAGTEKRLSLGACPHVSLAQARKPKDEDKAPIANGADPGALKQERRRELRDRHSATFAAQARAFLEESRKEGKAKVTLDKSEWLLGMAKDSPVPHHRMRSRKQR